jgi:hypothetical protein
MAVFTILRLAAYSHCTGFKRAGEVVPPGVSPVDEKPRALRRSDGSGYTTIGNKLRSRNLNFNLHDNFLIEVCEYQEKVAHLPILDGLV